MFTADSPGNGVSYTLLLARADDVQRIIDYLGPDKILALTQGRPLFEATAAIPKDSPHQVIRAMFEPAVFALIERMWPR